MAQFSVNTHRFDPYKNFKFRVSAGGTPILGVSKMSALKWSMEAISHREGGDPSSTRLSPSVRKSEPITLERGITHDTRLEAWANLVYNVDGDASMSLKEFRQDLYIELLNEMGQVAKAWKVYRCWVSEYTAVPELDANGNGVAIESIVIQNEGWERDTAVGEPTET